MTHTPRTPHHPLTPTSPPSHPPHTAPRTSHHHQPKRAHPELLLLAAATLIAVLVIEVAYAIDSEWPPAADPVNAQMSPGPGLEMEKISISIPNEFSQWFTHQHDVGGWNEWPVDFAIGDIEGESDGDTDIVLYLADEVLLGARIEIDWVNNSGTLVPLWAWKLPNTPSTPPGSHAGLGPHNCLIWDFDNDGSNEIALVGPAQYDLWGVPTWGQAVYVVQEDPTPPPGPWDFSVPPPRVLAVSEASGLSSSSEIGERLGICRVRDTAYRQDILSFNHDGSTLSIWRLPDDPASTSMVRVFSSAYTVPITHEYNHADIDGDGFDEFAWDGVLDFVDLVNGTATPTNTTNPLEGVWLWHTGQVPYDHMDQMMILDFDPNSPGLEINSLPEYQWTDPTGASHPGVDTLWNTDGTILRVNDDCPFQHPQSVSVGNWTSSRDGLESIYVPKSFSNQTVTGSEIWLCGSYAVDAEQNELAVDGGYWQTVKVNPPENDLPIHRATGPNYRTWQIDWDGDRSQDEILHYFWQTLIVWRMGEKGDWGTTPPPGMPTEQQVQSSWIENGVELWWDFYQGYNGAKVDEWGWNNGGPGRYTHYYQKLGEAYPGAGAWRPLAWDIGRDYREEIVVATPFAINIFYNSDPLPFGSSHISPIRDRMYRRVRMERVGEPYIFPQDPPCIGDLNDDNNVDILDLLYVLDQWGQTNSTADLNVDQTVDILDVLIVIGTWGPCP